MKYNREYFKRSCMVAGITATWSDLFDSVPFFNNISDLGCINKPGLVTFATDSEAAFRLLPSQLLNLCKAVQPYQLPQLGVTDALGNFLEVGTDDNSIVTGRGLSIASRKKLHPDGRSRRSFEINNTLIFKSTDNSVNITEEIPGQINFSVIGSIGQIKLHEGDSLGYLQDKLRDTLTIIRDRLGVKIQDSESVLLSEDVLGLKATVNFNPDTFTVETGVFDLKDKAKYVRTDVENVFEVMNTFNMYPIKAGAYTPPLLAQQFVVKQYVDDLDVMNVKLQGNQTINGVKTFNTHPIVPPSHPVLDNETANKKYVDDVHALVQGTIQLSADKKHQLVNDKETPGVGCYYGTNNLGNKGWYEFPTQMLVADVLIPAADVNNLSVTPYLLINNPGPNKFIQIFNITVFLDWNTIAYGTYPIYVAYNVDRESRLEIHELFMANTTDAVFSGNILMDRNGMPLNGALYLYAGAPPATAGDSPLRFKIFYTIIDFGV